MIDLNELERLERAASKAPWEFRDGTAIADDGLPYVRGYSNDVHIGEHAPDAALIVAARNALPELIAAAREAERVREQVRVLREALDLISGCEAHISKSAWATLRQALAATAPGTEGTETT